MEGGTRAAGVCGSGMFSLREKRNSTKDFSAQNCLKNPSADVFQGPCAANTGRPGSPFHFMPPLYENLCWANCKKYSSPLLPKKGKNDTMLHAISF